MEQKKKGLQKRLQKGGLDDKWKAITNKWGLQLAFYFSVMLKFGLLDFEARKIWNAAIFGTPKIQTFDFSDYWNLD